jgi:hypothetical protein
MYIHAMLNYLLCSMRSPIPLYLGKCGVVKLGGKGGIYRILSNG